MGKITYGLNICVQPFAQPQVVKDRVDEEIKEVLKFLPKGTKHLSTVPLAITSLALPFGVVFEHPLFEDGSRVDFEYRRDIYRTTDIDGVDGIKELNVITGIKYFKPDGTPRYP